MRKFITILVLLAMSGCDENIVNDNIRGSGDIVSMVQHYRDFRSLELSHSFKATVTRADSFGVTLRLDDNLLPYLDVRQTRTVLQLSLEPGHNYENITIEADIVMPDLDRTLLSGASFAAVNGFDFTHALRLQLSGASTLSAKINTGDVNAEVSGASNVSLTGTGMDLTADVSGASHLRLSSFQIRNANLVISGASRGWVRPSGILDADISGASVLTYYGNPTMGTITTSGTSSLVHGG